MIVVTGAAGKTGRAVIRALVGRGAAVRAFVHSPDQWQTVSAQGAAQVALGDLCDATAVQRAMAGARAVYHICPNVHPDEVAIGANVIGAAREAGVHQMVYHSVLHPQVEAMPHHWRKMRVEEALFASGLDYTILQPCAYMQNVLAQWDRIVAEGVFAVPYGVHTRLGMVDLEDVADAAAIVVTQHGHVGAIYELAGPGAPTQEEVADVLTSALGRKVVAQQLSLDAWQEQARAVGMADYAMATLVAMFRYYDAHGFWGNSNALGWLLGRAPATFEAFAARAASDTTRQ